MRQVLVNRGLPGSGKSYRTRELDWQFRGLGIDVVICSSDDYFICPHCKVYVFIKDRLGAAHRTCQQKCERAMRNDVPVIIIDNTCVSVRECRPYVDMGLRYKYKIEFLEPQTSWAFDLDELARRNTHGVSREALEGMLRRWVPNMTIEKALTTQVDAAPPSLDEVAAGGN